MRKPPNESRHGRYRPGRGRELTLKATERPEGVFRKGATPKNPRFSSPRRPEWLRTPAFGGRHPLRFDMPVFAKLDTQSLGAETKNETARKSEVALGPL